MNYGNSLKSLLTRLNYRVECHKLDNGCLVLYPKQTSIEPHRIFTYSIKENGFEIVENYTDKYYHEIKEWAVRIAILSHIMNECLNIGYAPKHIFYFNNNVECKGIKSIIDIAEFNRFMEKALYGLIIDYFADGEADHLSYANELGLEAEFNKIVDILGN